MSWKRSGQKKIHRLGWRDRRRGGNSAPVPACVPLLSPCSLSCPYILVLMLPTSPLLPSLDRLVLCRGSPRPTFEAANEGLRSC